MCLTLPVCALFSSHPSPQSVALTQDSVEIVHHGVFTGYNPLVLLSIVLQAITGLVRTSSAVPSCLFAECELDCFLMTAFLLFLSLRGRRWRWW